MSTPHMPRNVDDEFGEDLNKAIGKAVKAHVGTFSRYKQLIKSGGGQSAAFHLLEHHDLKSFEILCKSGFKDCTIESFIVSEKYRRYFTTAQLKTAQDRLDLF
jgi:hypothetical protein